MADKESALAREMLAAFHKGGEFYRTTGGGLFYHVKADGQNQIIELDRGSQALQSFLTKAGANAASLLFKYVVAEMQAEADRGGKQVEIHHVSHFNEENNAIYWDAGSVNGRPLGKMWRTSKKGTDLIAMGADGVLFVTDPQDDRRDTLEAFGCHCGDKPSLQLPSWLGVPGLPTFGGGHLSGDQAKQALMAWLYALFFSFPTKPILTLLGDGGWGKSSLAKLIVWLYMGLKYDVLDVDTDDLKDLAAMLTNFPLVAIDNWDKVDKKKFDMIARAATGGHVGRREYYQTNAPATFPFKAHMIVTQRDATLARDDLASRQVVLRCLELQTQEAQKKREKRFKMALPYLRAALLHDLQHILAEWEKGDQGWTSSFRMADYALLGHIIARVEDRKEEWDETLIALQREQEDYLGRGSRLVEAVVKFLVKNGGVLEGTAGELYDVLIAGSPLEKQIPTSGKLAKELKRVKSALAQRGVSMEVYEDKHLKQDIYHLEMKLDAPKLLQGDAPWKSSDGPQQQESQSAVQMEGV